MSPEVCPVCKSEETEGRFIEVDGDYAYHSILAQNSGGIKRDLRILVVSLNSRDGIGQQLETVAFSVEPDMLNGGAKSGLGDALLPQSWLSILWNTLQ